MSYLREIWHKYKPDFLFLSETKKDAEFIQGLQSHFGYDNLVTVDPNGTSGGLALFYNKDFQPKILYTSNRMIDVEAVTLGKKSLFNFCIRRSGTEIKGAGVGAIDTVRVGEIGTMVYNWRSELDYWQS